MSATSPAALSLKAAQRLRAAVAKHALFPLGPAKTDARIRMTRLLAAKFNVLEKSSR
jgi:hypothetical protein